MDFSELSLDCVLVIFSNLSHVELLRVGLVCQEWYELTKTNFLWKDICTQEFSSFSNTDVEDHEYLKYFQHKVQQDNRWMHPESCLTSGQSGVHQHSVRGVSFSPVLPNIFASCGYDSSAHIFDVNSFPTPKKSFCMSDTHMGGQRFARVRWMCDGLSIAVTCSTVGEVYIFDAETSTQPLTTYKDVSSIRLDRTGMAAHPRFPYLVAVAGNDRSHRNGGNISLIDTRMREGPVRLMSTVHRSTVRDIEWIRDDELLTASPDGTAKITNLEGNTHTIVNAAFHSSENSAYDGVLSATKLGNTVALGCGGCIEIWDISPGKTPVMKENVVVENGELPIWRVKYNQRGSLLFAADDDGLVRLFHRKKTEAGEYEHKFVYNVLSHISDVSDLDLSINEDYVVSASQSKEVGMASIAIAKTL